MPAHEQETRQEAAPEAPAPPAPVVEDEPTAPARAGADGAASAASASGEEQPAPPAADGEAEAPAAAAPTEPGGELDAAELRARAGKADEYLALAQRTQADFENYRKRMARDVRAAEARGMGRLAKELLPALDNLDRAIAAVDASEDQDHHLTQGIRLVQSELASALARSGIEGYARKGERFDPAEHEAVAQMPVEGAEPGTIVEVLQPGYRLNDFVLRPARVVVAG
ncbi:MAG TPA: nucleotide exchange factor GrpE [Solirubrobacteraceae bacterium]|nr:nucleotide exchange factor GrpE [Solirubrobacteraceae bacterium]